MVRGIPTERMTMKPPKRLFKRERPDDDPGKPEWLEGAVAGLRGADNHEDQPVEPLIELAIRHFYQTIMTAYRDGLKLGFKPPIVSMKIEGKLGVGKGNFEIQPIQASDFAETADRYGYPGMTEDFLGRLARVKDRHVLVNVYIEDETRIEAVEVPILGDPDDN
jgi:hypothetical protein